MTRDRAARRTTCCPRRRSSRRPRRRSSTSSSRENVFHLRPRLLAAAGRARCPRPRSTPASCEALGAITEADLAPLREAGRGRAARRTRRRSWRTCSATRGSTPQAPVAPLPHAAAPARARARARSSSAWRCRPRCRARPSLARAGFGGSPLEAAQRAVRGHPRAARRASSSPSTNGPRCSGASRPRTRRSTSRSPTSSRELGEARREPASREPDPRFPFVLSAGERRSFTANTIIRDPALAEEGRRRRAADAARTTRRRSASPSGDRGAAHHAARLGRRRRRGLRRDAARSRLAAERARASRYPADAASATTGVAPNELTSVEDRDPFVGTPWHKHVPARVERA